MTKKLTIPKDDIIAELNEKSAKLSQYQNYMRQTDYDSFEFMHKFDLNELLEEYDEILGIARMLTIAELEEEEEC